MLNINKLKETLSEYIKVRIELLKLDLAEQISKLLAQVVAYVVILIILGLVVSFFSMGIAYLINEQLQSNYLGFIIVAAFHSSILIAIFVLLRTGKLKQLFESILTSKDEDSDE